jgi:hypothetical protein
MKNRPVPSPSPVPPASRAQANKFLKGLQEFRAKGEPPLDEAEAKNYDRAGVKTYLDKMTVRSQQGIARRIMMDILKSSAFEGRKEAEPKRKTAKKKKASKAKSRAASQKKRSAVKKKKAGRRR